MKMTPSPPRSKQKSDYLVRLFGLIIVTSAVSLLFSNLIVLHGHDTSWDPRSFLSTPSDDRCQIEYDRITRSDRTVGLTRDDFYRSRAHPGNRYRLSQITDRLQARQRPVNVVVCGGSISLGHGVTPDTMRYSNQFENWLLQMYPGQPHKVYNKGSHGADMCAMAKRINLLDLSGIQPDLFVLEFSVNDYQGQDHRIHIDHKTDVFFDGFQRLALCAETVVYKLLSDFPNAAVVFLEFQTAILNRKTAQLLHMGVAQHYGIPVISYADTMFPSFLRLAHLLEPYNYSLPPNTPAASILPYPHGCTECEAHHIINQFRDKGCKSLCVYMQRSGLFHGQCEAHLSPCYVSFLAHDAVHPSARGHGIAKDLLAELVADTSRESCRGTLPTLDTAPFLYSGWLVAGKTFGTQLQAKSDYVLVQDTMQVFAKQDPLLSKNHSKGFALKGDQFLADRKGWIATQGGEYIVLEIHLPLYSCYAIDLSVLHSYETVGSLSVVVQDVTHKTETEALVHDCQWEPHISIPADIHLPEGCTGECRVIVTTLPEIPGRKGNTIKITSLAVRKCIETS